MTRHIPCLGIALLIAVAPKLAAADVALQVAFDTVDFVEIKNQDICSGCSRSDSIVVVRGVVTGQSTPSTRIFNFGGNKEMATRCERLATIAMAKAGKYQFSIGADNLGSPDGGHGHCQLNLVSP